MAARLIHHHDDSDRDAPLGGKASALRELSSFNVPAWFVVIPEAQRLPDGELEQLVDAACERLGSSNGTFAVRSSALAEDGSDHSFAGQFDSFLHVPAREVADHVRRVWESAHSQHAAAYASERGTDTRVVMAVLVQRMIHPTCAGVAFAVDPVTGDEVTTISFVAGTADRLVSGEESGHDLRVDREGRVERGGSADESSSFLGDAVARDIASVVAGISRTRGAPQDVEWAWDGSALHIVQARPITSAPSGELAVWDNSNIAESYAGVTTPLTFSFARRAYEEVYRTFCRQLGVSKAVTAERDEVFRHMLGSLRGRVYYNLMNWYRLIAMLPGYRVNAPFMEQMMGVESALPDAALELLRREAAPNAGVLGSVRAVLGVTRSIAALVYRHTTLRRRIRSFESLLETSLRTDADPFAGRSTHELVREYRLLECRLLPRWDAPILNDFFAMIFVGLLRKLCDRVSDDGEGLHNALLLDVGDIVSVQPARRIEAMAEHVRSSDGRLLKLLADADGTTLDCVKDWPDFRSQVDDYIQTFGDRCLQELKLETPTLRDDPTPLLRSVAAMASRSPREAMNQPKAIASDARLRECLRGRPVTALAARFVVPRARARVRDRENLRFARTRVFGYVRRLFVALGQQFAALGLLDEPRDIFFLEVEETLGLATGVSTLLDPRATASARREEFERQQNEPPLPVRFETRGPVNPVRPIVRPKPAVEVDRTSPTLQGVGCCPGLVRGRARVVTDPVGVRLAPGDILIAERTDPGWVMLFPAASAIAVQHGSVLSHTSIVARELGLPCAVAVPGLLDRVADGDPIEVDGSAGTVTLVEKLQ
ncbi:MAG: PEP/pyruvate-binding domain-containing protein [Planctomycetota bacterium]